MFGRHTNKTPSRLLHSAPVIFFASLALEASWRGLLELKLTRFALQCVVICDKQSDVFMTDRDGSYYKYDFPSTTLVCVRFLNPLVTHDYSISAKNRIH